MLPTGLYSLVRNRHFPWVYLRSQITGAGEGCEADRLEDRIHNLGLEQDKMFLCCGILSKKKEKKGKLWPNG